MTTTIEVIDTAVKIGLGAIISGVATYVMAKVKFKHDYQLETGKRQRQLLEEVAESTEEFTNSILCYWALLVEHFRVKEANKKISNELIEKIENATKDIILSAKHLSSAEAKLLLLGYDDCQLSLREYGEFASEFRRHVWHGNPSLKSKYIEEQKNEILQKRKDFFENLKKVYRKQ